MYNIHTTTYIHNARESATGCKPITAVPPHFDPGSNNYPYQDIMALLMEL